MGWCLSPTGHVLGMMAWIKPIVESYRILSIFQSWIIKDVETFKVFREL